MHRYAFALSLFLLTVPLFAQDEKGALDAAVFQVFVEPSLIDGHNRAQTHGDGWVFPERGHEPGVRIAGKTAFGLQFLAEVRELVFGQSAF